jgi:hypothetical protein
MAQMIGHTLGYRHADTIVLHESTSPGQIFIEGTTEFDYASVMWMGNGIQSWKGFSYFDQVANRARYPAGAVTVTSQGYDASGHPTIAWSTSGVPEANLFRVYYNYTAEYWNYDPSYPEGGFYTMGSFSTDLGTTTGTSFTDVNVTRTGNADCGASYTILPYYPSGKGANTSGTTLAFETC